MANQRIVRKNKAGVQDLILGKGQVAQQRAGNAYQIDRLDVPLALDTLAEMQALDVDDFTRARVYSDTTTFVDYIFDAAATEGVTPTEGVGFWVPKVVEVVVDILAKAKFLAAGVGTPVKTLGYTSINDGGGAEYVVVASGTGADDGGSYHDMANGNQLKLLISGPIDVKKFGATVDGTTNDTVAIDSAIAVGEILINSGTAISDRAVQINYHGSGVVRKTDASPNRSFIKIAQGDTEKTSVPVYGAFRQDSEGSGWAYIEDTAHAPNGLTGIVQTSLGITLEYGFTASKIGTLLINNDETFCSIGVVMGASVGLDSSTIFFYRDMVATVSNVSLTVATATTFDTPTATLNPDSSITLTHSNPSATDFQKPILSVATSDGNSAQQVPMLMDYTRNTVTYGMFKPISGYVFYDGADWQVVTNDKNKPTITAGSTGIVVTHETLRDGKMQITGRDNGNVLPFAGAVTGTTFVIAFRDFSGALINPATSPTADMRVYYAGSDLVQQENSYGNVDIFREKCILNPSKIYGATSNFWVSGDFEV